MDEFKATVDSLGQWSVENLSGIRQIEIFSDRRNGTAHMEIFLSHDTWQNRDQVIEQMAEIRLMFMDDLSIDYAFNGTWPDSAECASEEMALVYVPA